MKIHVLTLALLLSAVTLTAQTQTTTDLQKQVAALQDQVATLTAALKACQATTPASVASASNPRREAIASLHAVQSAVAGGANAAEFKKYQLDAKVKVDALPATDENADVKHVAHIYTDAAHLMTAWLTSSLDDSESKYFKTEYASLNSKPINELRGFSHQSMVGAQFELARLSAEFGAKALLAYAASELQKVK